MRAVDAKKKTLVMNGKQIKLRQGNCLIFHEVK